jgi:hypothetical protein
MESCKKCQSSIVQYVTWVWKNYFSLVLSSPRLITSPPMLERLDWVFDSPYWIINFSRFRIVTPRDPQTPQNATKLHI